MKIIYTRHAVNDLAHLHHFIARHNPIAASDTAKRLIEAVNRLKKFPEMGKNVIYKHQEIPLRDLITGKFVVRYTILKKEIHILRIWHSKEDRSEK